MAPNKLVEVTFVSVELEDGFDYLEVRNIGCVITGSLWVVVLISPF